MQESSWWWQCSIRCTVSFTFIPLISWHLTNLSPCQYFSGNSNFCEWNDWWLLIQSYSPLSWADSLRSHVVLHEWLAFYSALKKKIHRSGVLTVLAWLVPHETAAISAQVLCTPYNQATLLFKKKPNQLIAPKDQTKYTLHCYRTGPGLQLTQTTLTRDSNTQNRKMKQRIHWQWQHRNQHFTSKQCTCSGPPTRGVKLPSCSARANRTSSSS